MPLTEGFSFKNNLSELGKILRHENKRYAIVDQLYHFSNTKMNQCAATKIFKEAESMGILFDLKIVLNGVSPNEKTYVEAVPR